MMVAPMRLQDFLRRVFEAAGTPADIASVPAEHLVEANLAGYDSHGVVHIDHYLGEIERGILDPAGRPEIVAQRPSALVVDAHQGWGHFAGLFAIDSGIELARSTGAAAVSVPRCTHIGRLGHYVEHAARRGFISMVTWGAGKPPTWGPPTPAFHLAAPFGGSKPALSTNPFAFGVPTGDDVPFVVDFATTVMANARAWIYHDKGEKLPPGTALDREGRPTTDPATYMDGGTLMLFGGHKGYGLSLITTLLGGLTGTFAHPVPHMEGSFFLVIDPSAFAEPEEYKAAVRSYLDGMRQAEPAPGFDEVLVPGDYEARSRRERMKSGLEISETVMASLQRAAEKYGVAFDLSTAAAEVHAAPS